MKKLALAIATLLTVNATLHATNPATVDPTTVLPKEWEAFRYERLTVLHANPELAAKDEALNQKIKVQQGKIQAAMIKADPSVTPIVEKLDLLLKKGWKGTPAGVNPMSLAEWQHLRATRAAVLKTNPQLAATSKQLLKKRKALDARIDAALVAVDPTAAGYINQWPRGN